MFNNLPSEILKTDRLQLNVNARRMEFNEIDVLCIYEKAITLGPDIILQRHEYTSPIIDVFLSRLDDRGRERVTVLLDESRGTGNQPESWHVPVNLKGLKIGFAGGLGPDNIVDVANKIEQLKVPYWLDMESGIRTDNTFDLEKARAVLSACERFASTNQKYLGRSDWAQSLPAWPL